MAKKKEDVVEDLSEEIIEEATEEVVEDVVEEVVEEPKEAPKANDLVKCRIDGREVEAILRADGQVSYDGAVYNSVELL